MNALIKMVLGVFLLFSTSYAGLSFDGSEKIRTGWGSVWDETGFNNIGSFGSFELGNVLEMEIEGEEDARSYVWSSSETQYYQTFPPPPPGCEIFLRAVAYEWDTHGGAIRWVYQISLDCDGVISPLEEGHLYRMF